MGNGQRGRLISAQDRKQAVELISEAVENGARLYKACEIIKFIQERSIAGKTVII
ncbi:protein of unknown function [Petrocella atlantisensis]|uniref:Uncharacterized protein n=1 Tax=Petrocella atlantisensis TaxID=2173034 RepID=A0A3P7NUU4_9FIRM|nr:protein of unknown function [Petrocella atlantisensis]VDN46680.1 protein of unknown function [Petrocella atlantisensis]